MKTSELNIEEVRSRLDYDPDTGLFRWKPLSRKGSHKLGWFCGSANRRGYLHIKLNRKLYQAHRLAWFIHHGEWPSNVIDHINRDIQDNRLQNLRSVTQVQNLMNRSVTKNFEHPAYLAIGGVQ